MLDAAVAYVAQDSRPAAQRLLIQAIDSAASLDMLSEPLPPSAGVDGRPRLTSFVDGV